VPLLVAPAPRGCVGLDRVLVSNHLTTLHHADTGWKLDRRQVWQ
jgi:hypothetical protein